MAKDDLDLRERAELCDLFVRLGPAAPTMCEGWSTADLAAHLAIREHDPRSAPGILIGGRFEAYTRKLVDREKARGYEQVVERVRQPARGPLSIPAVRRAVSLVEFVVHHEDVRRANALPARDDRLDLQDAVWKMLSRMLNFMVRRAGTGRRIEIVRTSGATKAAGKGPTVTLRGEPIELLLYLQGRTRVALVSLDGAPADIGAVARGRFGL